MEHGVRRRKAANRWVVAVAVLALLAGACSGGADEGGSGQAANGGEAGGGQDGVVSLWSIENQPERVAITNDILARFTEATGIEAELVAINEDDLPNLMLANAASGTLPDVVFHPMEFTFGWASDGLLDAEAANEVVESLGRETFSEAALELATVDGQVAAVPTDGWGMILLYRTDLFEQGGLERPETYEEIMNAAETLNDPANNLAGISSGTDPGTSHTQQVFEHVALANGCQLLDGSGEVALDTSECVEAIDFYTTVVGEYGPGGALDATAARDTYMAGQAAMLFWSPFILDEMAGLRDDALPTCAQCAENPMFLVENTGVVGRIAGPGGEPTQWAAPQHWGIGAGTDTEDAQELVTFLMNEGYLDWLSLSTEGKIPLRQGTPEDPDRFMEGWRDLESGVDSKAQLSELYGEEVVTILLEGVQGFERWGEDRGSLVTALYSSLAVPIALSDVLNGSLTPEEAAMELQAELSQTAAEVG